MSSKPYVSPYRRNTYNNNNAAKSPFRDQTSKLAQKSKLSHSVIADNTAEKTERNDRNRTPQYGYRYTEKKTHHAQHAQHMPMNNSSSTNRLDTLLEQNRYLLGQNNQLSNIVNQRSRMVIALEKKLQQQISHEVQTLKQIDYEKNKFLEEYSRKISEQGYQNQRLMDEIAQLNQDIYQLEMKQSREVEALKEKLSREHRKQLDHILQTHAHSIDLLTLENNKNKSELSQQSQKIIELENQHKLLNDNYQFAQAEHLKKLAHTNHIHTLELSQIKLSYESQMHNKQKQLLNSHQILEHQLENQISTLKKNLNAKSNEILILSTQLTNNDVQKQNHVQDLQTRITGLEAQILDNQQDYKSKMIMSKQSTQKNSQTEIQAKQKFYEQMIDNLKQQNIRLIAICDTKTEEIKTLRATLEDQRLRRERENQQCGKREKVLKQNWDEQIEDYNTEQQALKSKMAHLRQADLEALKGYYENQMSVMAQQIKQKEDIINMNREKVHGELQQKNQMRKTFEIQVSKLKGRIGELQLKISGMLLERKDQIANFESRIEVNSMYVIRQSEEKEREGRMAHGQKKQLQMLIHGKDKAIEQLEEQKVQLIENHQREIQTKDQQISIIRKKIDQLELELKKQKLFYENQFNKKNKIHQNDKEYYESEINRIKQQSRNDYETLSDKLNAEKSELDTTKQQLLYDKKVLEQKLSNLSQFNEQLNLDNQTALHQTKTDLMSQKNLLEVSLKNYYNTEMKAKDQEIELLRIQLKEVNSDIRAGKQREAKLEDKMSKLIKGEEKLREMEEKVMAFGEENNIVKNLVEIVKKKGSNRKENRDVI